MKKNDLMGRINKYLNVKKLTVDEKNQLISKAVETLSKHTDNLEKNISVIEADQKSLIEIAKTKLKQQNGKNEARQAIGDKLTLDRKLFQYNSALLMIEEQQMRLQEKRMEVTKQTIDEILTYIDKFIKADNAEYLKYLPEYEEFGADPVSEDDIDEELKILEEEMIQEDIGIKK